MIQVSDKVKEIIEKYYTPGTPLYDTLMVHSEMVARKVMEIVRRRNLEVDLDFAVEAALLHDIGIVCCDAPGIHCHGALHYICHGTEGSRMLQAEGLPRHALVCERHTGSGLTAAEIEEQGLPIPVRDMLPQSIEERLVCYADKFYSKGGDLRAEKPIDKVIRSMAKFGDAPLARFMQLHHEFGCEGI